MWNKEVPRKLVLGYTHSMYSFIAKLQGYLLSSLKGGGGSQVAAPKSAQLNQPASLGTPCLSSSRAQLDIAQITDWGGSGGA